MWGTILSWVMQAMPVIPSLVTDIERLFSNQPKSGTAKAAAVASAIDKSVQDVANAAAKLAPAGTPAEEIAKAVAAFAKDVQDDFVTLANDLKLFPHAGQPAVNAGPPPAQAAAKPN